MKLGIFAYEIEDDISLFSIHEYIVYYIWFIACVSYILLAVKLF